MNMKLNVIVIIALGLSASAAWAGTYSDLAMRNAQMRAAEQTRGATVVMMRAPTGMPAQPPSGPVYYQPPQPASYHPGYARQPDNILYMLPGGTSGRPDARMVRWSYGQVNASSDPFNTWALSAQGLYVPWSTPMSGWTNSQTWNWWRERAGDAGPPPPLW